MSGFIVNEDDMDLEVEIDVGIEEDYSDEGEVEIDVEYEDVNVPVNYEPIYDDFGLDDDDFSNSSFYINKEAEEYAIQVTKSKNALDTFEVDRSYATEKMRAYLFSTIDRRDSDISKARGENAISSLIQSKIEKPDFIDGSLETAIYSKVQTNTNVDVRQLFETCDLDEALIKNQSCFYQFKEWIDKLVLRFSKDVEIQGYLHKLDENIQTMISTNILGVEGDFFTKMTKVANGEFCLFDVFISDGSVVKSFKCSHCGEVHPLPDEFVRLIRVQDSQMLVYRTFLCGCGYVSIFSKEDHGKLTKSSNINFSRVKASYAKGLPRISIYVPSNISVAFMLSDIMNVVAEHVPKIEEDYSLEQKRELDVDWEYCCSEFRSLIKMIGDGKFKVRSSNSKISNIAKIITNQTNSYSTLKENSLASLILALEKVSLSKFSNSSRCYYELYAGLTEDLTKLPYDVLEALVDEMGINAVKDKVVNVDLVNDSLVKIRELHENFDSDLNIYVANLRRFSYQLSCIPISKVSLREDMEYNYLYDERLKEVLDYISDLMILNHQAEDLFDNISLVTTKGDKIAANRRFASQKKQLSALNKKKHLSEYVSELCDLLHFDNFQYFLLMEFPNADALNMLSSYYNACLRRDVFDIHYYNEKLRTIVSTKLDRNDIFFDIVSSIYNFSPRKINVDKFDFYFGFECDRSIKVKFVNLYNEKGFVPKEIKGDTPLEKLAYYTNCSSDVECLDFIDKDLSNFLEMNKYLIECSQFINHSNLFQDYPSYMFMRDFLYFSSLEGLDSILGMLYLDDDLCSLLLEDSYEYTKLQKNILDNYGVLSLPLFDEEATAQQRNFIRSHNSRIKGVLDDASNLVVAYKHFPSLTEKLNKYVGDVLDGNSSTRT